MAEIVNENFADFEVQLDNLSENGAANFHAARVHPGLPDKKIAIVCDWLKDWGGAEQVLADMLELFPQADIYASVYFPKNFERLFGPNGKYPNTLITTSFLQRVPLVRSRPKLFPWLRPYAFESFDLSAYDVVISSSSAESKGIITKPETVHVCYCHSPTRYYWSHTHEYQKMLEFGILNPIARFLMPVMLKRLREWDRDAADRVDDFVANSNNTSKRIAKYYRRSATVITPGIDTEKFVVETDKDDYYLAVGRIIPYKKFDLLVDAFNQSGKRLIIATNTENGLFRELFKKSEPNIEWVLGATNEEKIRLYQKARAFVFPPEEDFGIVPLEAMACGTPVIAYGKGGALETVKDGVSGMFFMEQTPESLNAAIDEFETLRWSAYDIRRYASKFDKKIFQRKLLEHVESLL